MKRGVPRPPHVIDAMRRARIGKQHSAETRQRMGEAAKDRGAYPPAAVRPFTADEDALLGAMLDKDVAAKTGRHPVTIAVRRKRLGIASFRKQTTFRVPQRALF